MPSPNPQRTLEDLEKMHKMKLDLERLEQVRDEFMREAKKVRTEERFLQEISKEKEDLERDKMVLTEEMKAVNSDINKLDDAAKQSENERKIAEEKAKRLFAEMFKIRNNVNVPRSEFQLELLPDNLVDPEDEARFQSFLIPHHSWPVSAESYRQMAFAAPATDDYHRTVEQLAMFANVAATATASAASIQETSSNASSSTFGKQQNAPMKICNSCQQQIHRNAPICPLCKSKSRSRNPKKPKQRKPEDHNS